MMKTKWLSLFLAIAMVLSLLPATALAGDGILYLDAGGTEQICTDANVLTSSSFTWGTAGQTTWYVVQGTVKITKRVAVAGDVHLILADGCKLNVSGIRVSKNNSLTIYAQSEGADNVGSLTSQSLTRRGAGIGGNSDGTVGSITINGGKIIAYGAYGGAGIGGGGALNGTGGAGGTVTINGGYVTARGGFGAAGIGGGCGSDVDDGGTTDATIGGTGGTITINGGTVGATGGSGAAGIGGGYGDEGGAGGAITISGGTVSATGGSDAPGIGGGINGADGVFSTGPDGSAVIFASSISDQSGASGWSGVIFQGADGAVYGTAVTPGESFTIPEGNTLTIADGRTLAIGSGVTLTNNGTIYVDGSLTGTTGGEIYYLLTIDGGTASGADTSSHCGKLYGKAGGEITLEAAVPTGKTLAGWETSDDTVTVSEAGTFAMPARALTVTARFLGGPSITEQPRNQEITSTKSASLSVTAVNDKNSTEDLTYQWFQVLEDGTMSAVPEATGSTLTLSGLAVGDYTYYCVVSYNTVTVTSNRATVTVRKPAEKAPITDVVLDTNSTRYSGSAQTPAIRTVKAGALTLDAADYSVSYRDSGGNTVADVKNAGTYTVVVTAAPDSDFSGAKEAVWTVLPAAITVTPRENQNKVYGMPDPVLTYDFSGASDGETPAFAGALSRTAGEAVAAEYPINLGDLTLLDNGAFQAGNYELKLSDTPVFFAITPMVPTISIAANQRPVYDSNAVTAGTAAADVIYAYSGDGQVTVTWYADKDGEPDAQISAPTTVGTYWVGVRAAESATCTAVAEVTRRFQITAKEITITAKDQKITYGQDIDRSTDQVTAPLADGDQLKSVTLTVTPFHSITPSAAKIMDGSDDVTNCYQISYLDGQLTVNKAEQIPPPAPAEQEGETTSSRIALVPVPAGGYGAVQYVCSTTSQVPANATWQSSPVFNGLHKNTTYYFFARYAGDENHHPSAASTGTPISTYNTSTITFDSNGGNRISPISQDCGTAVTAPPEPTRTGYTFAGWDQPIPTTMPAEDVTITARWTANQYTITYQGLDDVAEITHYPAIHTYGTPTAIPDPSKTGYRFDGWKINGAQPPVQNLTLGAADYTANITLTAVWTVNQYTINFNPNGGSQVAPITQDYGTAVTDPPDPTRTGYTFAGWDQPIPTTMPAEDVTITARWTANQYTITYQGLDDVAEITHYPAIHTYGTPTAIPDPSKTGYRFDGWKINGAQPPVQNLTLGAADYTANITLTAVWTVNQYTINFNPNGGSQVAPITQDYGTAVTDPPEPTRTGYTFAGWDQPIPTTMPAENMIITARWTVNTYTVTLHPNQGTILEGNVTAYTYGVGAVLPTKVIRNGYTFGGWYDNAACTGDPVSEITAADIGDKVYYASWTAIPTYPPVVQTPTQGGTVTIIPAEPVQGDAVTITPMPDSSYRVEQVMVTDQNGNPIAVTDNGDGTYTFIQPQGTVTVTVTFSRVETAPPFTDVPTGTYYYAPVLWAVDHAITTGTSATTFSPNTPCTRAQAVTFLWRAAGSPAPRSSENPFTDVQAGRFYTQAVLWAVEQGITKGTSASTFSPDADCTRAQIVTFLWRAQGAPAAGTGNPFADVPANTYYTNAVLWAVENGITNGTGAATFSPAATCTRAQIVTFLYRCMR